MTAKITAFDRNDLIRRYQAGASAREIEKQLGVGQGVTARVLREAGIKPRSLSEALAIRMANMTDTQRAALTTKAHSAWRGSKHTSAALNKMAKTREAHLNTISPAEADCFQMLRKRGYECRQQIAVGRYNIDIACETVGVEILGGLWHRSKTHRARTKYILKRGWTLIFIWVHGRRHPLTVAAADYVASVIEEAKRNPSLVGQYRVIRGTGEFIASGGRDSHELPGIPAPETTVYLGTTYKRRPRKT